MSPTPLAPLSNAFAGLCPDGQFLAAGGDDGRVILYDLCRPSSADGMPALLMIIAEIPITALLWIKDTLFIGHGDSGISYYVLDIAEEAIDFRCFTVMTDVTDVVEFLDMSVKSSTLTAIIGTNVISRTILEDCDSHRNIVDDFPIVQFPAPPDWKLVTGISLCCICVMGSCGSHSLIAFAACTKLLGLHHEANPLTYASQNLNIRPKQNIALPVKFVHCGTALLFRSSRGKVTIADAKRGSTVTNLDHASDKIQALAYLETCKACWIASGSSKMGSKSNVKVWQLRRSQAGREILFAVVVIVLARAGVAASQRKVCLYLIFETTCIVKEGIAIALDLMWERWSEFLDLLEQAAQCSRSKRRKKPEEETEMQKLIEPGRRRVPQHETTMEQGDISVSKNLLYTKYIVMTVNFCEDESLGIPDKFSSQKRAQTDGSEAERNSAMPLAFSVEADASIANLPVVTSRAGFVDEGAIGGDHDLRREFKQAWGTVNLNQQRRADDTPGVEQVDTIKDVITELKRSKTQSSRLDKSGSSSSSSSSKQQQLKNRAETEDRYRKQTNLAIANAVLNCKYADSMRRLNTSGRTCACEQRSRSLAFARAAGWHRHGETARRTLGIYDVSSTLTPLLRNLLKPSPVSLLYLVYLIEAAFPLIYIIAIIFLLKRGFTLIGWTACLVIGEGSNKVIMNVVEKLDDLLVGYHGAHRDLSSTRWKLGRLIFVSQMRLAMTARSTFRTDYMDPRSFYLASQTGGHYHDTNATARSCTPFTYVVLLASITTLGLLCLGLGRHLHECFAPVLLHLRLPMFAHRVDMQ
ncbi:hypothetical protein CERSUDRAFT_75407 [Gelatoporia subvermispora B]|uniref:Uncharacterized protein n=1 Tax=Ceriporiopsis subvermispora (strain B) TaxID=914234 RepID=M2R9J0_CERS8|nr:hypothetical protein CERSUDRAFT_75407 [Gelatoporia subvermispora B]